MTETKQNWLQRTWAWCRRHQLKILSCGFTVGIVAILVLAFVFPATWDSLVERNILLVLGAWGGFVGLVLATLRQETFSAQVKVGQTQADTAEKNLFNDRLSRAVESLASKYLAIRMAGVRLLESLGRAYESVSQETNLIVNILADFINENAHSRVPLFPNEQQKLAKSEDDVELALDALASLNHSGVILRNVTLHIKGKKLNKMEFNSVTFGDVNNSRFENCIFDGGHFIDESPTLREGLYLYRTNFHLCEISRACFTSFSNEALVASDNFYPQPNFKQAKIFLTIFNGKNLKGACLIDTLLSQVEFANTHLAKADISGANFVDVKGLTQEQIDQCIFEEGKRPRFSAGSPNATEPQVNSPNHRRYKWEENELRQLCRRLVESGEWIESFTPWWKAEEMEREKKAKEASSSE